MYLPPLHPTNNSELHASGNVTIHPSAAIAPGVLLQADPESQIIIAAGACIGMGAVLHAHQGILEVEEGANIGTGVLIVGEGKIGANACIGSMTTILNSSIGKGEVVPPASLIGDTSRQVGQKTTEATTPAAPESFPNRAVSQNNLVQTASTPTTNSSSDQPAPESEPSEPQVYGQANLNRLLSTLLPHRQSLNRPSQSNQSSSNSS